MTELLIFIAGSIFGILIFILGVWFKDDFFK
jgi:hypothetical protein